MNRTLGKLLAAGAVAFSASGSLVSWVSATGANSCTANNGCIAKNINGGGEGWGFSANDSTYWAQTWGDGTDMNDSVSSARNRNSTYISFCVYQAQNWTGGVSVLAPYSAPGYVNASSDNTGSSHYFRVQTYC